MRDLREEVVSRVIQDLLGTVPDSTIDVVRNSLIIALNSVELSERTTELTVVDDTPYRILNRFIATKRIEGMSEKTITRYGYELKTLLDFCAKPLELYTTNDLRFYLSCRRQKKKDKPLSNRTLDGMRRIYSSFFSWLAAEKIISYNPALSLKAIKYKKVVRKPFSSVELQQLREACKTSRDLALIDWLYATGCRVSEVVNTDISDIDFETLECVVTGKGNKERRVYITTVCAMHLKAYIIERTDSNPALFMGKRNKRLTKGGIEHLLKKIGNDAGVKNVHPHRFRRTLGSDLYAKGVPILDIAEILGHEDIGTTKIYCYVNPRSVKTSYQQKMDV